MRRPLRRVAISAAGLFLCGAAMWAALRAPPLPVPAPEAACSVEQVRLHTGDGVLLDGILYRPAANPRSAAFLLVHGFGANYYEAYFPALARAAAAQGYASLALNMRDHDAGPKVSDFRDNQADIAAGLAHLRSLGYLKAVLLGQSMGTNRVLYYQAATRDSGIVAVVLVSGPGNLFEWNVRQFGRKEAQATLDEALALQAAGHEQQLMLINLGPLGKGLYTARYLLSLRGPNSPSDPYQNIRKVTSPVLILQGKADRLVEPGIAERLRRAATPGARVHLIYFDDADHYFTKQEARLGEHIFGWLKEVAP
jgi:pimeloyl-ACP methyl ester carboxylesterase